MRVFVIEESDVIRERLRDMLEGIPGIELAGEVDNLTDALNSISTLRPDVVTLGFMVASKNYLELLRQIRMLPLTVRVIVLTNDAYPQYRKKCMEAGADYFLDKTRDVATLGNLLAMLAGEV